MNSRINMKYGNTYLSAYSIAVKHGFVGTEREWLDSIGSGRIELKYFGSTEMICWKHADESEWKDLMSLTELQKNLATAIIGDMRDEAEIFAKRAESWAVGGTGTRPGEDSNNAKYWAGTSASGTGGNGGAEGGKRTAAVIVGTSAAGHISSEVDYLCNGTADEIEINKAMVKAAAVKGATVVILPGTYKLTGTVGSAVTVMASGVEFQTATLLNQGMLYLDGGHLIGASLKKTAGTGTPCVMAMRNSRITDCHFYPGVSDIGVKIQEKIGGVIRQNVIVENCSFLSECQTAIEVQDHSVIRGCYITKARSYGVYLNGVENFVEGNIFDMHLNDPARGVGILSKGMYNYLTGNTVRNTPPEKEVLLHAEAKYNMVVGNYANIKNESTSANWIMANLSGNDQVNINAVDSVNGKTGVVVLSAVDVGAAALAHEHVAGDITSGVLDIANGGTGGASVGEARKKLGIGMRGMCMSGAAEIEKGVTIDSFSGAVIGTQITVRFSNGNTVTNPTLNISGTGGMNLCHKGGLLTAEMIPVGHEALLVVAKTTSSWPFWELLNPSVSGGAGATAEVLTAKKIVLGTLKSGTSTGDNVFAQGENIEVSAKNSHAEGTNATASAENAHAEGMNTKATMVNAHAEGNGATAAGHTSHAEGSGTTATGHSSHAEGNSTTALGDFSHAEGYGTRAEGARSHAEGSGTTATGNFSHAEGYNSKSIGNYSHAGGSSTIATGSYSHAEGNATTAAGYCEFVRGQYNKASAHSATAWAVQGNAMIIGNGTNTSVLSNSFRTTNDGKVYALSAFNSSGADYGEYCEWLDGNPAKEDRLGLFVTWEGDKVRVATAGDEYILGVSTANSAVIGNSDVSTWNGMYKRDRWGRFETENIEIDLGNGEKRIDTCFVLNQNYKAEKEYVNRDEREEWVDVGMLGRLWVREDGSCKVNGYCKPSQNGWATISEISSENTNRTGHRVLKKEEGFVWVMFR